MSRARTTSLVSWLLALAAVLVTGCGGGAPKPKPVPPSIKSQCPKAADGQHGAMGACAPPALKAQLHRLHLGAPLRVPVPLKAGGQQVADLSNNDPCDCGFALRAQGYSGLIVKANQGEGFRDRTMKGMVDSARTAGLTVGAYDFDQDYTVGEAAVFVDQMHQAGLYGNSRDTFPAYLDVEYGNFSYGGLVAQVNYLRSQGYRVGIYSGEWYYTPHAGCQFPGGLSSVWLSGYPNASVPCGTYAYNLHQFTDVPFDRSVFIGSDYNAFVNAGPPPDPYLIFPQTKWSFGRYSFSEYHSAIWHDRLKCVYPFRRPVCVQLAHEIGLERQRIDFVAHHHRVRSHGQWTWASNRADYHTGDRGSRRALLARREHNYNPTYL